jgi:ribonuclease PH
LFRVDGRGNQDPRPIKITPSFLAFPEGSALIEVGETKVICTASLEDRVPGWRRGQGKGWVTAEYSMLPGSTLTRKSRELGVAGMSGRTQEIQRLIGRSLRSIVDMEKLGERTIVLDCDVIQADGGTRTAAISGAYIALYQAFLRMVHNGIIKTNPLKVSIAAISVGLIAGEQILDLCYDEDSRADLDFNIVMTEKGDIVEVQGTAEGEPFSKNIMQDLIELAEIGVSHHFAAQMAAVSELQNEL